MKELTWKPILSNLKEAFAELRRTHNILHFLLSVSCLRIACSQEMLNILRD